MGTDYNNLAPRLGFAWSPGKNTVGRGGYGVVGEALTFQSLFFVGLLLFAMTLSLNLISERYVRRIRAAY